MCYKCEIFHSKLCQKHNSFTINNNNDTFTGFCNELNHNDKLEFYCKTHNKLCCASCICKIEYKGKGQHNKCDIFTLENIKEEKKLKLNENIKLLENLSKTFNNINKELIQKIEEINKNKDNLKQTIQKLFTRIRNEINKREDELLLEVDKQFDNYYIKEDITKDNEKLPSKIKIYLEKGKNIEKDWNNENNLISLINDCLSIENIIIDINKIQDKIKKFDYLNNLKIMFSPDNDKDISLFLDNITNFGKIYHYEKALIFDNSLIIKKNSSYNDSLINWINQKINKVELLYRKSRDGDSFNTFHKLCDNQKPTLVLVKSTEGLIFGGYTPLHWDSNSGWKEDDKTFLFSLTSNKKFNKNKKGESIYCYALHGPFFAYIGFRGKNMSKGDYQYGSGDYFENYNEIIPNEKNIKEFNAEEVEIFKILFD